MNLNRLYDNSKLVSPYRSHYKPTGEMILEEIIPNINNNDVTFVYRIDPITDNVDEHLTFITFQRCNIETEEQDETTHYPVNFDGTWYWIKKHQLKNSVKVQCSCSDFYYTFAYYNWQKRCLFGRKPVPYHSKGMRPPRNPNHYAGMCKHIYWCMIDLIQEGYLKA